VILDVFEGVSSGPIRIFNIGRGGVFILDMFFDPPEETVIGIGVG